MVVGTYDKQEKPNIMTAGWVGICCSKPPCIAVSLRKARYTYSNIVERRAFTVSVPSEKYIKETDYVGIASGKKVEKFSATKLTAVKSDLVDAPYVNEFPLVLECRLLHTIEIGLHTQFIGEILDVKTLAQSAMKASATKEEIMETLRVAQYISGVGSVYTAAQALKEIV